MRANYWVRLRREREERKERQRENGERETVSKWRDAELDGYKSSDSDSSRFKREKQRGCSKQKQSVNMRPHSLHR
jgi:hypothetical protein